MEVGCEQARELFPGHWRGELSVGESATLEVHVDSCASCRTDLAALGELWTGLGLGPEEAPSASLRTRFYATLTEARNEERQARPRISWLRTWGWRFAAAAAMLVIGYSVGYGTRGSSRSEMAELKSEVASMRQMVALSLLREQSASDRLRGVTVAGQAGAPGGEVVAALIAAMRDDESVNVRLAAVDALHAYGTDPLVRQAALTSLDMQEPLVQLALIDLLVDIKERRAALPLKALLTERAVDGDVRQRAQWALERLQ